MNRIRSLIIYPTPPKPDNTPVEFGVHRHKYAPKNDNPWTRADDATLVRLWPDNSVHKITLFMKRAAKTIHAHAQRLDLPPNKFAIVQPKRGVA